MDNTSSFAESSLPLLKAVSYVRVSTTRQAVGGADGRGFSIPAQREANRRHAHGLGALVVAEFVERGCSGRSVDRPALRRMLDYVQTHVVDLVIVHKVDRLARNRADDANLTNAIHASGARLVSSTEAIDVTPSGRLLHGIMASIAEFYSQNLATEVKKGMRQKVLQGGSVGRAPLGYLNTRTRDEHGAEHRIVTVDPDRGPHITWAFQTYATGTCSVAQLVAELNHRGLTTRATPSTPAAPVTLRTVHHLLKNPFYTGVVTLNGVEHPGNHEPLIDPVTWATVQDMLAARRNGQRARVHNHYLKSTVYCIECGRRLIIQNTRSKSGRVYQYFICSRRQGDACTQRKALPVADVEARIEDAYRTITLTAAQRQRIEDVALAALRREQTHHARRRDELNAEARANETRRDKLLELHYSDAIPRDALLRQQRRLNAEATRIQQELAAVRADDDALEHKLRHALDLLQDVHDHYRHADHAIRQQLNQALFARVLLGPQPDQIRIELNDDYDALVNTPRLNTEPETR